MRQRVKTAIQPYLDVLAVTSGAYADLKSQLNDMAGDLISFEAPPLTEADERLRSAVSLLRPWTSDTGSLARVGGGGDGGYVMWSEPPAGWALSVGVGPDVSWDQDVAGRGAGVDLFDPTIRKLPAPVPGGTFHRIGISDKPEGDYLPLTGLLERSQSRRTGEAYLKMDVEGFEWSALAVVDSATIAQFAQITMELHDMHLLSDAAAGERILGVLDALYATHLPVHLHANNYSRVVRFGRYWFRDVVEASWVRRDFLPDPRPVEFLDGGLDRPCDPRTSEIDLTGVLLLDPAEPVGGP